LAEPPSHPGVGILKWQDTAVGKQPWYFTPADGEPITFAGLWNEWKDKATGEILHNDHYAAERFCCLSPRPHARNPCAQQLCKRRQHETELFEALFPPVARFPVFTEEGHRDRTGWLGMQDSNRQM
jgi:hypothetical protein